MSAVMNSRGSFPCLPTRVLRKLNVTRKSCLLAEHDPWTIRLLRVYLEKCGFGVVQAFEGQDVLPLAMETRPTAILLESDLPGTLRSAAVVGRLKANPKTCDIPIILFTWLDRISALGLYAGTDGYLQKPVTYQRSLNAIAEIGISDDLCDGTKPKQGGETEYD